MTTLVAVRAVVAAAMLLAGETPAPPDPAALAAQLTDPARREAAFCALLRLQRYRGEPRYREDPAKCAVNEVVVAPQREGRPMYLVVKLDPKVFPDARLGSLRGPFTLIDGEGYIVPIHASHNVLEPQDELIHWAGDERIALSQAIRVGDHGWAGQVLTVVPVEPSQRALLRVAVGPPIREGPDSSGRFSWTWAWREVPGSPPVLQIGPMRSDAQLASVAAEFTYSAAEDRYVGPKGGAAQGFLLLDPEGCCSAAMEAYASAILGGAPVEPPTAGKEPAHIEPATPCTAHTEEHTAAKAAVDALAKTIAGLESSPAQLDAANRALSQLLASQCFRMSQENPRSIVAPTALSLRTWWNDGGEEWIRSYLSLADTAEDHRYAILPPDMRPEVKAAGTGPGTLVCTSTERQCGADTLGWIDRATTRLATIEAEQRPRHMSEMRELDPLEHCFDSPGTYRGWRACAERARKTQPALPLGRFQAPRRGWFVVTGRRGHHDFCDGIRAYDLATGAAHVAESCSGLVLREGGTVDGGATDAKRQPHRLTGRVPLDNLREAAWMAILAGEVAPAQMRFQVEKIPAGLKLEWLTTSEDGTILIGIGGWGHSGQTRLSWAWIDDGKVLAKGKLTWPSSASAGPSYAVELLRIAEAALVEGPAPAALPPWVLDAVATPSVNGLDAAPESISETHRSLRELLRNPPRARPAP